MPLTAAQQAEIEKRLQGAARENRIPCATALAIAKSLGVDPGAVGKAANLLNIRISRCQLGCF
ncbi:MAG: hypothetical protein JRD64_02150 [Deltaproteobacteria bacterium]|nr:hypothetical protein [Deltaproteobacteria bacterium]